MICFFFIFSVRPTVKGPFYLREEGTIGYLRCNSCALFSCVHVGCLEKTLYRWTRRQNAEPKVGFNIIGSMLFGEWRFDLPESFIGIRY